MKGQPLTIGVIKITYLMIGAQTMLPLVLIEDGGYGNRLVQLKQTGPLHFYFCEGSITVVLVTGSISTKVQLLR